MDKEKNRELTEEEEKLVNGGEADDKAIRYVKYHSGWIWYDPITQSYSQDKKYLEFCRKRDGIY